MKGRLLQVFLPRDGGEFALKTLNLTRPLARRLRRLFNLILTLIEQPATAGGRLFPLGH